MKPKYVISLALTVVALTGCAQLQSGNSLELRFFNNLPPGYSSVWDDGVSTFILPKRGQGLDAVQVDGKNVPVDASGSYFRITGTPNSLVLIYRNSSVKVNR
jgi:hypothetical protein